jgi:hypothetical protein
MDLLADYVALQSALLLEFQRRYQIAADDEYAVCAARSGEIELDGQTWRFQLHGTGIRFSRKSKKAVVVDVEELPASKARAFSAYRLSRYLRSVPGNSRSVAGKPRNAWSESDIALLLEQESRVGGITKVEGTCLYELSG